QARDGYTAALRAYEETHDQTGVSDTQVELSRLLRIAGDAAGARALLTPALAALREAEAADLVENGELLQMLLDLDAREPDRVLQQRAAWSKRFDSPYRAGNQSFAHSRLARALLAKAELAEAQREAGEAVRVTEASDDARPRVEALLTDAQVQAAAGDRAAARARLEQSAELARRAGRAAEYELELELAALDKADGAPGWKAQLAALAKRARGEKFVLYARRAARLGRD
ncbi:MAG TPA: hypothetical protein VNN80_27255, partial [Polyangiaceae bacterium]|nr:hypothetical protein [Polyangiaceae bacterium]